MLIYILSEILLVFLLSLVLSKLLRPIQPHLAIWAPHVMDKHINIVVRNHHRDHGRYLSLRTVMRWAITRRRCHGSYTNGFS
jgi:hypothetical protein